MGTPKIATIRRFHAVRSERTFTRSWVERAREGVRMRRGGRLYQEASNYAEAICRRLNHFVHLRGSCGFLLTH